MIVLVGCATAPSDTGGAPPPPTMSDPTARQFFDTQVYPILSARCAGCHGMNATATTGFVGTTAEATYDALTASDLVGDYTANAPLIRVMRSNHPAVASAYDLERIQAWLALERDERGL